MKITESRTKEILNWLDDEAGNHALLFEKMTLHRDAAALIRQLQAELDAGREQGRAEANYAHTVPDECETVYWRGQILSMNELAALAQQPASNAPVGVEDLIRRIDAAIERITSGRCTMRVPADPTDPDLVLADAGNWIQRHALAQQPAAVDVTYPTPRNRAEALALARLALSYLGVIDSHISAAITRCETDSGTKPGGSDNDR